MTHNENIYIVQNSDYSNMFDKCNLIGLQVTVSYKW